MIKTIDLIERTKKQILIINFGFFRSFSYVFEARNTADTHQYAIKKMSCHTKEEEKRAKDEIENYQRFSHPNLGLIE